MNHGVARVFKVWRLAFLRAVVAVLTSDDGCQAGNFGNRFEKSLFATCFMNRVFCHVSTRQQNAGFLLG